MVGGPSGAGGVHVHWHAEAEFKIDFEPVPILPRRLVAASALDQISRPDIASKIFVQVTKQPKQTVSRSFEETMNLL